MAFSMGPATDSTDWGTHNSGSPRLHIGFKNGTGWYKGLLQTIVSSKEPHFTHLTSQNQQHHLKMMQKQYKTSDVSVNN